MKKFGTLFRRLKNLVDILFYMLKMISFVFYVYRPLTSKNAKGITGGLAGFQERTCSRKEICQYTGKPEERGLYLPKRVFCGFSSKKKFQISDKQALAKVY